MRALIAVACVAAALLASGASATCPALRGESLYFTSDVNWTCAATFNCLTAYCGCVNGTLQANATCTTYRVTNQTVLQGCLARRAVCTLNAALASDCAPELREAYPSLLHASDRAATNVTSACVTGLCEELASHGVTFNTTWLEAGVCTYPNFTFPPVSGGSGSGSHGGEAECMEQGSNVFESVPFATCASVEPCSRTMCSCVNGTYAGAGNCQFPADPAPALAQRCLAAALSCVVNAALSLYVPQADETNPTTDACVRWSVPIARDYKAYYAATNKQATDLYATCNRTACKTLGDASLLAGACAFTAVTRAPTYEAPSACPFKCPDDMCARYLANCTCVANAALSGVNASFTRALTSFDVTNSLASLAFGTYKVATGNCSTYDFNPFMAFSWVLSNASNARVYAVNGSALAVPALAMVPASTYTLTLTVRGLIASATTTLAWTITTVAPTPVVSITRTGAALRVSNSVATTLPATVTDAFPGSSPSFTWSCAKVVPTTNDCPVLTNKTIARLVIPADSLTGTFTITYTYKAIASSLNLTIVAGAIPFVRIAQASVPVVAVPALYLPTQTVILASSVTGVTNVTLNWTVNGVSKGTGKSLAINATALIASTAAQLSADTPVANTIVLRATSAADATVYGESSIVVVVAPAYTLSLAVTKASDSSATSATGLADNLKLVVATNLGAPAPYGLASTFAFQFMADTARPLNSVPTSVATEFTALAPMPYNATAANGAAVSVAFTAQLLLAGKVVNSVTTSFNIVKPDPAAAATAQIAQAAAITDPTAAVAAAANIQTLLQTSTDPATLKALATAAVNLLANSVKDFGSQSTSQQAAIFETLTSAVGVTTDATAAAELKAKTLALMTSALSSTSFDPANAGTALNALASVGAKDSAAVINQLAQKFANDPAQAVGTVRTLEATGVKMAVVKQSASSMGGTSVSDGSTSLSLGDGFQLDGVDADSVVSIAQSSFSTNTFGTNGGADPATGVVSILFNVDGGEFAVNGLSTPIEFVMIGAPANAKCFYWKTSDSTWSSFGMTSTPVSNGVKCSTDHLTSFGSFGTSSSAGAALSVLVALALLLVQMLA